MNQRISATISDLTRRIPASLPGFPRIGLTPRLTLLALLLLLASFGVAGLVIDAALTRELNANLNLYGRGLARQAALVAAPRVLVNDKAGLEASLDALLADGQLLSASVSGKDGQTLAERHRDGDAQNIQGVPFIEPIEQDGQRLGFVSLSVDRPSFVAQRHAPLWRLGLGAICLIILSTAVVAHVSQRLARALRAVSRQLRYLADGQYQPFDPVPPRRDEIGQALTDSERLRAQLAARQQSDRQMARFALSPLTQALRQDDSGELAVGRYMNATLFLVEYVNLGTMSERLTPEALAELLNTYHALLARACKLYNGQIDKYYGDGVVVVFGLPRQDEEHAFHALCAAMLFQQLVSRFNASRNPEQNLQVRLCLHTGPLMAAILGGEQAQFTVLGDTLNLVMRLATVAGPDDIVLSKELADLPELKARVQTAPHRNVLVKGRTEPTPTYRLSALGSPYDELLQGQTQHLQTQLGIPA